MEIRKLNALRGIAVLIVAVSHYSNSTYLLNGMLGSAAGQDTYRQHFISENIQQFTGTQPGLNGTLTSNKR